MRFSFAITAQGPTSRTVSSRAAMACLSAAFIVALAACGGTSIVDPGSGGAGGEGSSTSTTTTSSTSATTGTGVDPQTPECMSDADCQLINDCCSCLGLPLGAEPPSCDSPECFALTCDSAGYSATSALCRAGRCVAGFPCDSSEVFCNGLPPDCDVGQAPVVSEGCWGGCADASECESVDGCEVCAPSEVCVQELLQTGPITHCVTIPQACAESPTCACMGESVCVGAFGICEDQGGAITCGCPTCS